MLIKNLKITTLSEDITQFVKNACDDKLELPRLCKDHHNPIMFYDKKPVLEITQDECIGIFAVNSNHYFLSSRDSFRLGCYCKLPISGIIALMLKAEWEQVFAETFGNNHLNNNWNSKIKNKKLIQKFIAEFQPDTGQIINLVIKANANSGCSAQHDFIKYIIEDLITEYTFLMDNKSVCEHYPEKGYNEKTLMFNISKSEKEKYLNLKHLWKYKSNELDELLYLFERKKRIFINLENKYYRMFGNYELKKSRLNQELRKYQTIYKITLEHPEYSYRKLLLTVGKKMIEDDTNINELKNLIARSKNQIIETFGSESGNYISNEFKETYTLACKKLLRKIYFLLHPDNPSVHKLTEQKKDRLKELWLLLMKTTKDELYSYSPSMLLYHQPDYEKLELIYKRACKIIGVTPDMIDSGDRLEFMIRKGTSISGIIEFLDNEIKGLEQHLAYLEIAQDEYTHEMMAQFYRSSIENVSNHEENLKNEVFELKKKISNLKQLISIGLKQQQNEQEYKV